MKVYGDFTQAELDEALNARGTAPDFDEVLRRYDEDSARVRARFKGTLGIAFGPSADETLDIFPAERAGAPIQLFIHGGYWRILTRTENSFAAEALVPAGATVVVINYALAPHVSLDEIVRQCRAAIAWTWKNARSFGADPDRLFISGHSAGGHLVGMMLATDWERDFGAPADVVKGATAVSGLYDLTPGQQELRQRVADARRGGGDPQQPPPQHSQARLPAHRLLWRARHRRVPPPVRHLSRRLARQGTSGRLCRHARLPPFRRHERDRQSGERARARGVRPDGPKARLGERDCAAPRCRPAWRSSRP